MEILTALVLLLLIVLPVASKLFRFGWLKSLPLPPSPSFGLPIIGHFHLLLGGIPHKSFHALAEKHGSIFFLRLGMVPAVVVSSAKMAKEVLKDQDLTFASRPYLLLGDDLGYKFMAMTMAPYSDHWKMLRKVYTLKLFTSKRIDSFLSVRLDELSHVVQALLRPHKRSNVVDMRDLFTTFNLNILTRILMNKRYCQHKGEQAQGVDPVEARVFKEVLNEISEISTKFHVSDYVPPYLRWIDWSVYRMRRLHSVQDETLQQILNEHKSIKSSRKDFMDLMLEALEGDPRAEHKIKASMTELLIAGSETSATTIEWTFAELLRHPHVVAKAQEELDSVVGSSRTVVESDLPHLVYLQAIVKEVLRLHPPAPLLLPHMSMRETSIAGYHVPKGSTTVINAYSIGRDPALWDEPLEFRPERFLGSPIDVKGQHFELIPFGSGRRSCPGMGLALRTLHLALASLLHGFSWRAHEENALEEKAGAVILLKTPLKAVASPRLAREVLIKVDA